ncbi:MAG: hypothetical protein LBH25_12370 [Fibromonadaceae bacterium]|jgi:hypothetical protein|nr:hypothetical protein [Fibromonadaceae bacterium]
MKKSFKTFACIIGISILLLACPDNVSENNLGQDILVSSSSNIHLSSSSENSSSGEMPVMNSRVKSYKKSVGVGSNGPFSSIGFITDEDILKSAFPYIFESEQTECKYFAIYFANSSASYNYNILSQDMILYTIIPDERDNCPPTTGDILYSAMLVCDDTVEGSLKDSINLNSTHIYIDLDWDCRKESEHSRNVFF